MPTPTIHRCPNCNHDLKAQVDASASERAGTCPACGWSEGQAVEKERGCAGAAFYPFILLAVELPAAWFGITLLFSSRQGAPFMAVLLAVVPGVVVTIGFGWLAKWRVWTIVKACFLAALLGGLMTGVLFVGACFYAVSKI